MGSLAGRVAVITGGASGIGAATARLFVAEGASVVVADIQEARGAQVATGLGERALFQRVDVTSEADVRGAVLLALERFGRLDCMFNNAGAPGVDLPIGEIPVEGFDQTVAVLLRGVFLGIKHAAPVMVAQGVGSIINTASVAGLRTGMAGHVYSAAKAAVIHLTRSAAMELGEGGVRVNCICPGGIATPIFGRAVGLSDEEAQGTVELMGAVLAEGQPIKRAGQPEDIARAALWLAGDDSSFVNGHALVVDGGMIGGRGWSAYVRSGAFLREAMGGGKSDE